jgi:hypothetical protein
MGESALERAPFFRGKVLTPEDLELTQQYFREKLKRHNRSLHGFGIVSGLKVTVKSGQIVVEPGLALDCEGNELYIERAQAIIVPPDADWHAAFVDVRFIEACADRTANAEAENPYKITSYLAESFEVGVAPDNSNRGHRHVRASWLACGQPHALTIAKLKHSSQGWRVERGYRAPHIK